MSHRPLLRRDSHAYGSTQQPNANNMASKWTPVTAAPTSLELGQGPYESKGSEEKAPRKSGGLDQEIEDQLPDALKPFIFKPLKDLKDIPGLRKASNGLMCCYPFFGCCMTSALIRDGEIGLSWRLEEPVLLDQGWHLWLDCFHRYEKKLPLTSHHIQHGPIHLIRVAKGMLGYAEDTKSGKPMLLVAGTHYIKKAEFKWGKFLDLNLPENDLGALKIVRVDRGTVAYFFQEGELKVLQPGLHVIAPPDRFGGFVSTQLELLDLPPQIHESADYVRLKIDADVLYCIVDPRRALIRVHDLKKLIRKTATSTLAGIIRSSNLSEVAGSRKVAYSDGKDAEKKLAGNGPSAPSFQQKVHDEFLKELHDYMLTDLGVEVTNIRINDLRIADTALASKISKEAVKVAEQEAEYRMLQKETDILTVRANNQALEVRIKANAKADQELILVKAKNDAHIAHSKAQAQSIEIKAKAEAEALEIMAKSKKVGTIFAAQADADAILLKAEAEKKARMMQGEGDKSYASMVESTKVGAKLAALEIQQKSLKGISKVAYIPSMPDLLKNTELSVNVEAKDMGLL
uniref:Band 7 domain-containing protein n=1 Tax=Lotharella globosa TaxID=91324 RepID=A0A7S3ZIQ4_9EUKA|mmetsp:Transcript_25010/g.48926  ORF Transcript_25010/g.48926 Transcript_25010/m.48926 type:complete len:573 (+) Transcript_25010:112-1830(+)